MKNRMMCALVMGLVFSLLPGYSFSFEPISRDFAPSGPGSIQSFKLVNDDAEQIAVRIRILHREADEWGKERLTPADDLFTVYPSQIVVKPKSVQAVRIQWKGGADFDTERCFRILVEQLPVNFSDRRDAAGGNIRIMFRYLGALYILPPGAEPDIVLEAALPAEDAKGSTMLELAFRNRGKAHAILGELSLSLSDPAMPAAEPLKLDSSRLAGISGENILPGRLRRFVLPVPEGYWKSGLNVVFAFEPVR
jgi:fimbrial chaperone protein